MPTQISITSSPHLSSAQIFTFLLAHSSRITPPPGASKGCAKHSWQESKTQLSAQQQAQGHCKMRKRHTLVWESLLSSQKKYQRTDHLGNALTAGCQQKTRPPEVLKPSCSLLQYTSCTIHQGQLLLLDFKAAVWRVKSIMVLTPLMGPHSTDLPVPFLAASLS